MSTGMSGGSYPGDRPAETVRSGDPQATPAAAPHGDDVNVFKNPSDRSSSLFDLRYLIGGLFTLYGIILIVAGFFTNAQERAKANGIDINLWLGIGMLVLGLLFLLWARTRPLRLEGPSALAQQDAGTGVPPHA